ncbi:CueP family metal-binding protein [Salinicoccus sp. ID82-1]|uniref:Uncharacterized protein n=1 Tax=Salinicoccus cyprini TaxID=2493691 RepID=A0A558AU16_9STAP|nr:MULTISPECIES: CueP family metal-binding protein [Salinicoccus]MCG1010752.1 CueP family metal-binding protein [Salinicoccus sp. ID82-1]TVT27759.1 hypothetical protein FO441_08615 [Salinicoccus cyprini]
MKKYLMSVLTILMIVSTGCSNDSASDETSIKEFVSQLSASNVVESASINDRTLVVQDGGEEEIHDLPEDEFFVSIAPYLTYTHPCEHHNLIGCQGELADKEMDVKIIDDQGEVHIDQTLTTLENGFMDFWLPRDREYTIEISYEDKHVEHDFSTFDGDGTCLTDLQLK